MISQEFTVRALNRLRRRGGQLKYKSDSGDYPQSASDWTSFLSAVQDEILDGTFRFRPFTVRSLPKNKKMFTTHSLENIMVMRKINDNIRRAYRVKQANRLDIIRQVQQALRETTPKHVIRLDIRSFYESVPKRALLKRLRTDRLISTRTLDLLNRLLKLVSHQGTKGLPRGLQISATLAELHAIKLERSLREISGIYYVARYVDDIVLFSYTSYESIAPKIDASFRACGLTQNTEKTDDVPINNCRCISTCIHAGTPCPCASKCKCQPIYEQKHIRHIDILGYRIAFPDVNDRKDKQENEVRVYMADRKISKYKRRIYASTASYRASGDFDLLADRVQFLTGNHRLESTNIGGRLMGGIYYNFASYRPYDNSTIFSNNRLEHLDDFLKSSLLSALAHTPAPSRALEKKLLSMSFVNGHKLRRTHSLTPLRISEVGECWNDS